MTKFPSDGPRCRGCKSVILGPAWCMDDQGCSFCSDECYSTYVNNLLHYLEACEKGRFYLEARPEARPGEATWTMFPPGYHLGVG